MAHEVLITCGCLVGAIGIPAGAAWVKYVGLIADWAVSFTSRSSKAWNSLPGSAGRVLLISMVI